MTTEFFIQALNLAKLIGQFREDNVSCDGRGGESIGRSRGLSPRPSSTHLLALEFSGLHFLDQ